MRKCRTWEEVWLRCWRSTGTNESTSNDGSDATMSLSRRSSSCAPFFTPWSMSAHSRQSPWKISLRCGSKRERVTLATLYSASHE
jgi:hypothetical protein